MFYLCHLAKQIINISPASSKNGETIAKMAELLRSVLPCYLKSVTKLRKYYVRSLYKRNKPNDEFINLIVIQVDLKHVQKEPKGM